MNGPIQSEEALFEAALRIASPAERAAWLDQACAGQPELRRRLEQLLAANDKPETFLDKPAAPNPPTVRLSLPTEESLGTLIGRYKLLEKVGEGGFGVVYVAEQREPVKRRVALKIIKLGMDTRQVVARFEAERQALALMDHPNIAKVLDAGATDNGRPYFVMELVRGIKVTEYCDQNRLSTRDRLGLFIQICHAIQHAHQKGIIHRDIKPSNILVTLHDGVPVPKVIDFGIAKATQQELTDKTLYTQLQQFIGTPAYMSPEQAEMSGLDIDTRSDVYSLGVLLYELLTGRTPFDQSELIKAGVDGMRKTIREKDPVRPSTRVATLQGEELSTTAARHAAEAPRLIHLLRGDLDWIVMKCLEKDRTRRFETANGLAMDLKRHLNNEPVTARPPGRFYRFQKSVRRNKLAFAAAGAVAAALVIGLGVSIFLYIRENEAYQRAVAARREADKARDNEREQHQLADSARGQLEVIISFMMQDLQPALEQSGRLPLLRQIAEKAVHYYEGLPAELRDSKMEFGHACALGAMARVQELAGDRTSAKATLRKSLELHRRVAMENPNDPEAATILLRVEWWWQADFMDNRTTAEYDAAQQSMIQQWRRLCERFPDYSPAKKGLAAVLVSRGLDSAAMFRNPAEAVAAATEGRALLAKQVALEPDDRLSRALEAQTLVTLAIAYEAMNEREKSIQLSEQALARYGAELKLDPGNEAIRASAAEAARFLSYRVASVSPKESLDAELVAREHYGLLAAIDPANAQWRHDHAWTHLMECYYLQADGSLETARQAFRKFDSMLKAVAVNRPDREKLIDISAAQAFLAAAAGDVDDARAHLATGDARFQEYFDALPTGSFDRVQARVRWLNWKSDPLLALRDWTGLESVARQTLTVVEDGLRLQPENGEFLLRRAVAEGFLGTALLRQGNAPAALPVLESAVAGYREAPTAPAFTQDREAFATVTAESLAEALAQTGDIPRARSLLETAFALRESRLAKQPDLWGPKDALARTAVLLATTVPSGPEDAHRRRQLLDRAASILNSPEAASRLSVDDQELKTRIDSSIASLSALRASP